MLTAFAFLLPLLSYCLYFLIPLLSYSFAFLQSFLGGFSIDSIL
ncbi:hypothetical protein HMPREF6123_2438 [Oribacterium sinus F0268]|uniref:Uncharacterized protein n=1 Tax=Oribacterium sinus F0268 TaxID=585501 RepID=C2L119_9FIRM|nr:hypothetical protein HMPREF6123_2438 [Oribacterium sinus F0268]